jgi:hypothetical protein
MSYMHPGRQSFMLSSEPVPGPPVTAGCIVSCLQGQVTTPVLLFFVHPVGVGAVVALLAAVSDVGAYAKLPIDRAY